MDYGKPQSRTSPAQMLDKKAGTLTKPMDVEAKKMRTEVGAMEKEVAAMRAEKERNLRARRLASSKGVANRSQLLPGSLVDGQLADRKAKVLGMKFFPFMGRW